MSRRTAATGPTDFELGLGSDGDEPDTEAMAAMLEDRAEAYADQARDERGADW